MTLEGKKILLIVCGGIAAYKTHLLARLIVKEGGEVQAVFTEAAHQFVTPQTMATLTGRPVLTDFADPRTGAWTNHVELGLWADLLVIAPATADFSARAAAGLCDSLALACYLSARCPVLWCPAMDLDMYAHKASRAARETLKRHGDHILEAASGPLASGLDGQGRLPEPEEILERIREVLSLIPASDMPVHTTPKPRVLITAGPTYERLDAVRYIGNFSSGRMGIALVQAALEASMAVTLVAGPMDLSQVPDAVEVISVESADEMLEACRTRQDAADWIILAAAVADYRPRAVSPVKLSKHSLGDEDRGLTLSLIETVDVATALAQSRPPGQRLIGFALEHGQDPAQARGKLHRKNLDAILFNSLDGPLNPMGGDENELTIVTASKVIPLGRASKGELARRALKQLRQVIGEPGQVTRVTNNAPAVSEP